VWVIKEKRLYNPDAHGAVPLFVTARTPKGEIIRVTGELPAIVLMDPKYPHNLGQTIRACSAFGVKQLWWTGDRVLKELEGLDRIPREERMRGYEDVKILHNDRPFDAYAGRPVTPVAVEYRPGNSEELPHFIHPENALYVFGPEDGGLDQVTLKQCHRFLFIPTKHCLNLSMAVGLVLYDRLAKAERLAHSTPVGE